MCEWFALVETNKIANRAGAPDTKTSASSQHFLQNPAPEDKRPALVPLNVKNTLLYVHPVKGAPGDGNLSLTAAIKLALKADQLSLTNNEEARIFFEKWFIPYKTLDKKKIIKL